MSLIHSQHRFPFSSNKKLCTKKFDNPEDFGLCNLRFKKWLLDFKKSRENN